MVYTAEIITTFIPYPWNNDLFIHNWILFKFCIKYLLIFSSSEYTTATVDTDLKQLELTQADLQRATEEIRGLHSINSELRSQLEVLSSRFVNRHSSRPGTRGGGSTTHCSVVLTYNILFYLKVITKKSVDAS